MTTWVEVTERENTITIDGYTSNKTERGIIKDVARVVAKYDKDEANALLECLKMGLDEYNNPFVKASESEGGYFFEYEEMSATRYNEETNEVEYKDGFHNYFCIRIVKKQEEQEEQEQEIETMENTYVTYEEPLNGRCFTEKQMKEVYRDLASKTEYPSFDIWFTDMIKSEVFERVTITAHTYVCELPEAIQNKILQECEATFKSLAYPVDIETELDNVKGCKMCDLEDTINVLKYYTK